MKTRVVLAMHSAKQRALTRLGLEMSGELDVVGVATEEADVEFIVRSLRPGVVLVDLAEAPHRGLGAARVVRSVSDAVPVMYEALLARHTVSGSDRGVPRPVQIAKLLQAILGERRAAVAV